MIHEMAKPLVLKKRDAPAVGMVVGLATALRKTREAEGHIRGHIAVHAEQLAHGEGSVSLIS